MEMLARKGYRVIALAATNLVDSTIDVRTTTQSDFEEGMEFLGLAYLANELKSTTVSTINQLKKAQIQTNMITGDHLYTAIAIAYECEVLSRTIPLYTIDLVDGSDNSVRCEPYDPNGGNAGECDFASGNPLRKWDIDTNITIVRL